MAVEKEKHIVCIISTQKENKKPQGKCIQKNSHSKLSQEEETFFFLRRRPTDISIHIKQLCLNILV